MENKIRVQKILADCGIASRRKAEEMIAAGEVKVNGKIVQIGDKADPRRDKITVRGRRVEPVREAVRKAEVYVFEEKGKVEGFIGLDGEYVSGIFVAEETRSRGVGRDLLNHVKALRPALSLNVYEKNERGVRFYQREGFVIQKQDTDPETGESEFVMRWEAGRTRRSQDR